MQPAAYNTPAGLRVLWLSNPTLILCLAGLVLPNALSLGALVAGIGVPPRTTAIFAYATIVLIARTVPPLLAVVLFLAVVAGDAIATIALLFNLSPLHLGLALHLIAELDLFASPLYAVLCLSLAALVVANILVLTLERNVLRLGSAAVLMSATTVFATADFLANASAHYHYGTLYGAGQPVESAVDSSGFRKTVMASGGRNVLVVLVEALGHFADPQHQAILLQPFDDPALNKRYEVSTGTTTYYGSTTAAELRELCDVRDSYAWIIGGPRVECLPQTMAARGYRTVAMHGFTGRLFHRDKWYPSVGFQERIFRENLAGETQRQCGGPFKGPCDVDLVPLIGRELQNATTPTFFYWLTLSTHVPVVPREGTPQFGCDRGGGAMGRVEVCYMSEMWSDLLSSLVRITADIPPTDILIVGDHAPPLWSKTARHLFTPGKVTWVRLTPRAASRVSALP